jgi:hypothetical protein
MTVIYLFRISLILGFLAVYVILITRTYWRGLILAITSIFVSVAVVSFDIVITIGARARAEVHQRSIDIDKLELLGESLIRKYAKNNSGRLPCAEKWCNQLLENDPKLRRENFVHRRADELSLKGQCHFAFNSNLCEMEISKIPDDVILLFEANGDWNLNGTDELLKPRYSNRDYVSLVFVDGTRGDYYFRRKIIRSYEKQDENGNFIPKIMPRWSP